MTKPKTVLELYEGHPERWIRGRFARDADGECCRPASEKAACWCASGAIEYIYGVNTPKHTWAWHTLIDAFNKLFDDRYDCVSEPNDTLGYEKTLRAIREAGI